MPASRNTLQPLADKWDAFYCRLSRDDDNEGDSNSIQHQKQILERYARDHGIEQYRYYVDDGYSGTNFNRPGFKQMLADIEAGHVTSVIVKDMSRFGRNYLEVGIYTEIRFPELDVRFIAINDGVDSEDQMGNDFTPFRNIINEWMAKDTSKKIRAVFRAKGMTKRLGTNTPYGYLKGEDGTLVKDEETAPVVQMMFQLCAEGNGPGKIARILRERRINTPRTTDFLRTGRSDHYDPEYPYGWSTTTVANILKNKEYLGHTINFKTTKKSYKSKQIVHNPEEKQVLIENTHEAIISIEVWDIVQRSREQRHRPTRSDTPALFSGLLFCSDCGSRLTFSRITYKAAVTNKYFCGRYSSSQGRGQRKCTAHYIREDSLECLVLDNLRKVIAYARDYQDEFVQQVTDNTFAEKRKQQIVSKRQLEQQTRRIAEIDAIIQRLYEDVVKGRLTDERFAKMSAAYEQEQKALETTVAELQRTVEACEQQKVNVSSFLKLVKSYIEPNELTPEVLRMFVEKIIVHEPDKSSGHRIQQVEIYYNFVGQVDKSAQTAKVRRRSTAELMGENVSQQQCI